MRLLSKKVVVTFEWRRARKNRIIDMRGRRLRDFSWRERGYELRGKRVNVNLNVIPRKPKRLESLSLVDEASRFLS